MWDRGDLQQRLDHVRVEPTAGGASELSESRLARHRSAIGTLFLQRDERVAGGDHTRGEGDRLAGQPVRIT